MYRRRILKCFQCYSYCGIFLDLFCAKSDHNSLPIWFVLHFLSHLPIASDKCFFFYIFYIFSRTIAPVNHCVGVCIENATDITADSMTYLTLWLFSYNLSTILLYGLILQCKSCMKTNLFL